jgi:DNA-binding MarR family transcriptional regulator
MSAEELTLEARSLYRAVSRLARVYQFRDRDRICCHDLSITQYYTLEAIILEGPMGLNDLVPLLVLDKSTLSRVIDGLERKGYVKRERDPEDGRAVRLASTPAGRDLQSRIEADLVAAHRQILEEFEPGVRRSIPRAVERLAEAAAVRVNSEGGTCRVV